MPCDSIILQSIDLEKLTDMEMLESSVKAAGGSNVCIYGDCITFDYEGSYFKVERKKIWGNQNIVGKLADSIKREYSKASVYASAKRMGWLVKEVSPNKLQVYRRF